MDTIEKIEKALKANPFCDLDIPLIQIRILIQIAYQLRVLAQGGGDE